MKVTIEIDKEEVLNMMTWINVRLYKKEEPFFKFLKKKMEDIEEIDLTTPKLEETGIEKEIMGGVIVQLREDFKAMQE